MIPMKIYADIIAPAIITDVLNSSFLEGRVPSMWKIANIAPPPKAQDIEDFNKALRPIALTSTPSKIAEEYIIQNELKNKLLRGRLCKSGPLDIGPKNRFLLYFYRRYSYLS